MKIYGGKTSETIVNETINECQIEKKEPGYTPVGRRWRVKQLEEENRKLYIMRHTESLALNM